MTVPVPTRVSTIELLFDLVFVFTITQVTQIIVNSPNGAGVARAAIELAVIFWMYGGYAWLTNTTPPDNAARRLILIAGMAAFFVASLAVVDAFDVNGLAFGVAYLLINLIHAVGFVVFSGRAAVPAVRRLLPWNLVSAGLVLAAAWTHGAADWVLWLAAIAVQWMTPWLTGARTNFRINADHFAERHGLVILIVLGESLISVGTSGEHDRLTVPIVLGILAGLAAVVMMWLAYFVHDDDLAAAAMDRAEPSQRSMLAIGAYFFAHLVMIFGVLTLAAGARISAAQLTTPAPAASAWLIASGGALYLLGASMFRFVLRFAPPLVRAVAALTCLATVPIGTSVSAAAQLLAIAAVFAVALAVEHFPIARSLPASGRMPA